MALPPIHQRFNRTEAALNYDLERDAIMRSLKPRRKSRDMKLPGHNSRRVASFPGGERQMKELRRIDRDNQFVIERLRKIQAKQSEYSAKQDRSYMQRGARNMQINKDRARERYHAKIQRDNQRFVGRLMKVNAAIKKEDLAPWQYQFNKHGSHDYPQTWQQPLPTIHNVQAQRSVSEMSPHHQAQGHSLHRTGSELAQNLGYGTEEGYSRPSNHDSLFADADKAVMDHFARLPKI